MWNECFTLKKKQKLYRNYILIIYGLGFSKIHQSLIWKHIGVQPYSFVVYLKVSTNSETPLVLCQDCKHLIDSCVYKQITLCKQTLEPRSCEMNGSQKKHKQWAIEELFPYNLWIGLITNLLEHHLKTHWSVHIFLCGVLIELKCKYFFFSSFRIMLQENINDLLILYKFVVYVNRKNYFKMSVLAIVISFFFLVFSIYTKLHLRVTRLTFNQTLILFLHWLFYFLSIPQVSKWHFIHYYNSDFSVNRNFQVWTMNHFPKSDQMSLQWTFLHCFLFLCLHCFFHNQRLFLPPPLST